MDLRENPRLCTALLPVHVGGLGELQLDTCGRVVDVSANGLRVAVPEPIDTGEFLRLDFDDCVILGEVRYCECKGDWYTVGLLVEEVVLGRSELSRLIERLLEEAFARSQHSLQ